MQLGRPYCSSTIMEAPEGSLVTAILPYLPEWATKMSRAAMGGRVSERSAPVPGAATPNG